MSSPAPLDTSRLHLSDAVGFEVVGGGEVGSLHPDEEVLVADGVEGRRAQFAAGRGCARLALAALDLDPEPVLRGEGRSPRWPARATGSISHTDGYAVAIVRRTDGGGPSLTLGIDAERTGRVDEHLYERLFVGGEQRYLATLEPEYRSVCSTAMFGLKESFYKAQFVVTGEWVGFHDVELTIADDGFVLRPATGLAALGDVEWPIAGHWYLAGDLVVSAVEVTSRTTNEIDRGIVPLGDRDQVD